MDFLAVRKALLAKPEKMYGWIFLAGICVTILLAVLDVYKPEFFRFLDYKLYDTQLRSSGMSRDTQSAKKPVIVDIDEQSLAQFGQWPWPRYRLALLLRKIHDLGASSVGMDMFFPESDRTSLASVQKDIEREYRIRVNMEGVPPELMDNDRALADVLSRGPFVLAYNFVFSGNDKFSAACLPHPLRVAIMSAPGTTYDTGTLFRAQGATCSIEKLGRSAASSGFFNVIPDTDGVLRRAPLLMEYNNRLYPSLSLATVMQSMGIKQVVLKTSRGSLESIVLNGTTIPVDAKANLLIRFHGKAGAFKYISARDILTDQVPREEILGKIVLLGTSAVGLEEYRTTPLVTVLPGTEIHATIVDNILGKVFFSRPDWVMGLELLLVVLFGVLSGFLVSWTRSVLGLCVMLVCGAGLWFASGWTMRSQGIFISPLFPVLALCINFSFLTFLKYWHEEKELRSRNKELVVMQNFTIQCLAALTETRDSETGGHILRCQHYVRILSKGLAKIPQFSQLLNEETIDLLYKSAPLHDIGKVGIPDRILLKPDRLTEDEYVEMKKHTLYGREAIRRAEQIYGKEVNDSFLQFGKEMAYSHHEKWDGSGYPEGLTGENIPIFGRIMAIADVYDALICKRRYKPSFSHEEAVSIIAQNKGTHFDPIVVEVFLGVNDEFRKIAQQFPDD
jgi:HD-GYP domain-containing protein (c-di-GMP phosphodiesterase class II)